MRRAGDTSKSDERTDADLAADAADLARLAELVQSLDAIIWEADPVTLRYTFVSDRAHDILGFPSQRWLDDHDFLADRIHPDDRAQVIGNYRRVLEEGSDHSFEYSLLDATGQLRWVRDRVHVKRAPDGTPLQVRGIMVDITERKDAEAQLRDSEERYRRLAHLSPDAIMVHQDGLIVYANVAAAELLGASEPDDLIGTHALSIVHPDFHDLVAARMRHEEAGTSAGLLEERFIRVDGGEVDVEVAGIPFLFAGRPAGQIVARDITRRNLTQKKLRETESRYRALVEQIPAVLYVDEPNDRDKTLYISPQVEPILGLPVYEWLEDHNLWYNHLHPDDRELAYRTYRSGVRNGRPFSHEYRLQTPLGTIWIRDDAVVLSQDDGRVLVQGVMFDITEEKVAEATLLESEAREREAASQLRALDAMKNTFLAAVSHELRSPLTAVLGLALTLEMQTLEPAEAEDLLHRLAANARKLDRLLTDLLDIDRLSRGIVTPQLHPTDIGALVRRTIEAADFLGDRHVLVEADPVVVSVDRGKIERIVENLLVNTVRHTTGETQVWVRVRSSVDGGVLLVVEDDGPGIPKGIREAIFEPFRQGPTKSAHSPGTGIGLSLVLQFAQLHGGRAWVQDRQGGGASFHVAIPPPVEETSEN